LACLLRHKYPCIPTPSSFNAGENGYIRIERKDPSTLENEDDDCGYDMDPSDGVQCEKDENGKKIVPPSKVKVCGTSGILFDATFPVGAKLL